MLLKECSMMTMQIPPAHYLKISELGDFVQERARILSQRMKGGYAVENGEQ